MKHKFSVSIPAIILYSVLLIAVMIGIADASITFINMQQMMFFYRLYYADWFIALYMLVNGILYSSIGAWMGYRMGEKLKQVMGT